MLIQRPTNRRAGCEKIARPVRREGQGQIPCSYPYPIRLLITGSKIRIAVRFTVTLAAALGKVGLWNVALAFLPTRGAFAAAGGQG